MSAGCRAPRLGFTVRVGEHDREWYMGVRKNSITDRAEAMASFVCPMAQQAQVNGTRHQAG